MIFHANRYTHTRFPLAPSDHLPVSRYCRWRRWRGGCAMRYTRLQHATSSLSPFALLSLSPSVLLSLSPYFPFFCLYLSPSPSHPLIFSPSLVLALPHSPSSFPPLPFSLSPFRSLSLSVLLLFDLVSRTPVHLCGNTCVTLWEHLCIFVGRAS